jgi:hypothetical protein
MAAIGPRNVSFPTALDVDVSQPDHSRRSPTPPLSHGAPPQTSEDGAGPFSSTPPDQPALKSILASSRASSSADFSSRRPAFRLADLPLPVRPSTSGDSTPTDSETRLDGIIGDGPAQDRVAALSGTSKVLRRPTPYPEDKRVFIDDSDLEEAEAAASGDGNVDRDHDAVQSRNEETKSHDDNDDSDDERVDA